MNKSTKIGRLNTVLFTTITRVAIQIVLKICSLFFGHFCFVVVYAKIVIHLRLSVSVNSARIFFALLNIGRKPRIDKQY